MHALCTLATQKLLMIDNKAFKSAEDIKTLGNKTEKMNEFVMLLQHEMLQGQRRDGGYEQYSSSALVYRYYSEMVLEWEEKIGGYVEPGLSVGAC
jgi:hypothetical protein